MTLKQRPHGSGSITSSGYVRYRSATLNPDGKREHVLVAEKALGRSMPDGAVVHHVNEITSDNRPDNLVICPNEKYHNLLHKRMRALKASGNANLIKCKVCKQYDRRDTMYCEPSDRHHWHRECMTSKRMGTVRVDA